MKPRAGGSALADLDLPSVLQALSEPAAIIDPSYRILAANATYRETFTRGEQVCGRFCYEVSHGRSQPCSESGESCPLVGARQTGRRCRALHLHDTNHGKEHEAVTVHPLFNGGSQPTCFLEILCPARLGGELGTGSHRMVGESPAFLHMLDLVSRAAPTPVTVLLLGESGTGKELVARTLHDHGSCAQGRFVPVDCSGLSESLFESELFGHEKGAFTGACGSKRGLVEEANGGTLFLDEVGDIPLSLQVKLLRLLETGTYRRVGGVDQRHSGFRLVCATHRDLKKMVAEGAFRQDLFYRISAFPIQLPPLRERSEDIAVLIDALLERMECKCFTKVAPEVIDALQRYDFPGNIRELHNILERASLLAEGEVLTCRYLPSDCFGADEMEEIPDRKEGILPLEEVEARYLRWADSTFASDRSQLAELLGLSERTLYRKLKDARQKDSRAPLRVVRSPRSAPWRRGASDELAG